MDTVTIEVMTSEEYAARYDRAVKACPKYQGDLAAWMEACKKHWQEFADEISTIERARMDVHQFWALNQEARIRRTLHKRAFRRFAAQS